MKGIKMKRRLKGENEIKTSLTKNITNKTKTITKKIIHINYDL